MRIKGPQVLLYIITLVVFGKVAMTIARAMARRIGAPAGETARDIQVLREEIEQLHVELDTMRGRLVDVDEMQNRLDFAERMLMQSKERAALPAPKQV